jgi:hypothetical protein
MAVSDVPPPDEPMSMAAYRHRWPTGAEKVELLDGTIIFYGAFDARDAQTAALVYPGRRVRINLEGGIEVHPAGPPRGIWAEVAT